MPINVRTVALIMGASLSLAACSKSSGGSCSDEESTGLVVSLIKDGVRDDVVKALSGGDENAAGAVGPSQVNAALDKLKLAIEDIRTASSGNGTTAKSCKASLRLVIPVDVLNSANEARSQLGQNSVGQLADMKGLKGGGNGFTSEVSYSIQPTDDGKKIYAEADKSAPSSKFLVELLSNYLSAEGIQRAAQAAQAEAQQQAAQQTAAEAAQRKADLQLATAQYKLAIQQINAVWQSINPSTRQQILPIQRAWIAKTKADCRIEASTASTEPDGVEAARLNCEAGRNRSRADELRQESPAEDY